MSNISYKTFFSSLALGLVFAFPALAGDISISGQVAHVQEHDDHGTRIMLFMTIENAGPADQLYGARSDIAKTAQMSGGVDERPGGQGDHLISTVIDVPANGRAELRKGSQHVMLADLKKKVGAGDTIQVTLFFEKAGPVKVDVPIVEADKMGHGG